MLGGNETAVAMAVAVRERAIDRRRTGGGDQQLTPGGSYTSSRSSIWYIETSSFRAVATIAFFELFRWASRL